MPKTKTDLEFENASYRYLLEGVHYYFYERAPGITLKEAVEHLKAFDIIKEHRVNLWWLMDSISCREYNLKVAVPQLQLKPIDYSFLRKVFSYDNEM